MQRKEPFNPLQSVGGRGSDTFRARALEYMWRNETWTHQELYVECRAGSEQTVKRMLRDAHDQALLKGGPDTWQLTQQGRTRIRGVVSDVGRKLAEHMSETYGLTIEDAQTSAFGALRGAGWFGDDIDEVADRTAHSITGTPDDSARLLNALNDN